MSGLKKVLSYRVILLITINSIMGTGIFFLPALGAKTAGPASIISWVILSIFSIYIAMCFGELCSMFPKAGGIYEYCKQAYGRFPSFIIGWTTLIAGNITIAMLVVGAIHYLLPYDLPFIKILISLVFIIIFNFIAYRGMKTSAVMLLAFAIITLSTLLGLIIPGAFSMQLTNFTPFFVLPFTTLFVAIFIVAETFFGWETATFLAAETKNGAKVMPKALVNATIIIAIISLVFVITSLGVIPWQEFGISSTPLIDLSAIYYGTIGADIFIIAVYLSIIGSVAGWIIAAPRLILAMSEDKLFLRKFNVIHPKHGSPFKAIILQTIVTCIIVLAGFGSYTTLLKILIPLVLTIYSATLLSVVVLRIKKPNLKRFYKVPFGKTGPIIAVLFSLFLLIMWLTHEEGAVQLLMSALSLILLGIPVYFLIEMYYDPKMILRINNGLAWLNHWTSRITFPNWRRRKILALLGNIKGKTVLDYGCSIGAMTTWLARSVGKNGRVIATDEAPHALKILDKRLKHRKLRNVTLLLDKPNKLHPKIPNHVDAIVGVSSIGFVQDVDKVLNQMNRKLKIGDEICFVEADKFFDVIPNIAWLSKTETILRIFSEAGFKVHVERKQGFAWQYIYIYGHKIKNV